MSIKPIFSVLDAAANAFGNPFIVQHVGVAIRELTQAVNSTDATAMIAQHPQDFALYQLGEFDDTQGKITAYELPKLIAQAASLKNPTA